MTNPEFILSKSQTHGLNYRTLCVFGRLPAFTRRVKSARNCLNFFPAENQKRVLSIAPGPAGHRSSLSLRDEQNQTKGNLWSMSRLASSLSRAGPGMRGRKGLLPLALLLIPHFWLNSCSLYSVIFFGMYFWAFSLPPSGLAPSSLCPYVKPEQH